MSDTFGQIEAYDSDVSEEALGDHASFASGNAPQATVQPPRKRARKSRSNGTTSTVAKRKGKGRQLPGSLSELLNMPLDVFFEVAVHLHPLDMLHLSRTSKAFRAILLAKTSRAAWMASLSNVDRLPSCPEKMCQPVYVALLFDQYCFLCGTDPARWVDYAIRLRLCQACCKISIRKGSAIVEKETFSMLPLFPCETRSDKYRAKMFILPENRTARNKYYDAQVKDTIRKYSSLKQQDSEDAKRMMEETLKDVAAIHIHAAMLLDWFEEKRLAKLSTDTQIASERKSKITERLQVLGYTEDDFPTYNDTWDKLVDQPKPLTDRIWNNIRAKLEEQLTIEAERRIGAASQTRVDNRLVDIVQWYEDYLEEHFTGAEIRLMPNRYDAGMLPSLLSLAEENDAQGAVPYDAFASITDQMLAELDAYRERVKRSLVDACEFPLWNPQTCGELKGVPADDVLARFFTYFSCRMGCAQYMTHDELHAHWREWHPEESWFPESAEDEFEGGGASLMVAGLSLFPEALEARRALEAVGIPLDTPQSVLDEWTREGRLFCACEHPEMPLPAEMSWGQLLRHLLPQLRVRQSLKSDISRFRFQAKHNPDLVLRDNHSLEAGPNCCIKFLPEGDENENENSAMASARVTIDDALRAQIEATLAALPEPRASAVCRVCKELTSKTLQQARKNIFSTSLPAQADAVVWHLRSCHGKEFELRDIVFVPRN